MHQRSTSLSTERQLEQQLYSFVKNINNVDVTSQVLYELVTTGNCSSEYLDLLSGVVKELQTDNAKFAKTAIINQLIKIVDIQEYSSGTIPKSCDGFSLPKLFAMGAQYGRGIFNATMLVMSKIDEKQREALLAGGMTNANPKIALDFSGHFFNFFDTPEKWNEAGTKLLIGETKQPLPITDFSLYNVLNRLDAATWKAAITVLKSLNLKLNALALTQNDLAAISDTQFCELMGVFKFNENSVIRLYTPNKLIGLSDAKRNKFNETIQQGVTMIKFMETIQRGVTMTTQDTWLAWIEPLPEFLECLKNTQVKKLDFHIDICRYPAFYTALAAAPHITQLGFSPSTDYVNASYLDDFRADFLKQLSTHVDTLELSTGMVRDGEELEKFCAELKKLNIKQLILNLSNTNIGHFPLGLQLRFREFKYQIQKTIMEKRKPSLQDNCLFTIWTKFPPEQVTAMAKELGGTLETDILEYPIPRFNF